MNPILSMIKNQNNISMALRMLQNKNPEQLYEEMLKSNPQFKSFVDANKGKSAEQIATENGIDSSVLNMFKK